MVMDPGGFESGAQRRAKIYVVDGEALEFTLDSDEQP